MMPIVDGKFESQIMTYYRTVEEGKEEIASKIKRARKIRISNVPVPYLKELLPLLKDKDLAVILPEEAEPWPELTELCDVAQTKSRIFVDYKGIEALTGSISVSDVNFSIIWDGEEILDINAMNYSSCVKCQKKFFETGWRYSKKISKRK